MNKILSTAAAFLFATTLASAWQYPGGVGGPPSTGPTVNLGSSNNSIPKREKPPEFRTLTGKVLDKDDSTVKDAIVYLKNRKTETIQTLITDADGAFRFPNLSRTEDYEVYAEVKGQKSPTKVLSSFDNRTNARLNLHVEPVEAKKNEGKEKQVAKTDEKKSEDKEQNKDQPK